MGGKPRPSLTVGWREWVSLPDLTDVLVKAKVDTGARTSSLHAEQIRVVRRGEKRYVRFLLVPTQGSRRGAREVIAPFLDRRLVRSSNGSSEKRVVVATHVRVGSRARLVEMTLTARDEMGFRLLLGRQAIRALRASVNPLRSFVNGKVESESESEAEAEVAKTKLARSKDASSASREPKKATPARREPRKHKPQASRARDSARLKTRGAPS